MLKKQAITYFKGAPSSSMLSPFSLKFSKIGTTYFNALNKSLKFFRFSSSSLPNCPRLPSKPHLSTYKIYLASQYATLLFQPTRSFSTTSSSNNFKNVPELDAKIDELRSLCEQEVAARIDLGRAHTLAYEIQETLSKHEELSNSFYSAFLFHKSSFLFYVAADFKRAHDLLANAFNIYKITVPHDDPDFAQCISDIGRVLIMMDNFENAKKWLLISNECYNARYPDANGCHVKIAKNFVHLGTASRSCNDIKGSISYFEQAISIYKELNLKKDLASATQQLGVTEVYQNNGEKAKSLFAEALTLHEAESGENSLEYAIAITQSSLLLLQLNREGSEEKKKQKQNFLKGIELQKKLLGGKMNYVEVAEAYIAYANILRKDKDYEEVLEYLNKSYKIWEKTVGQNHESAIKVLIQIVEVQSERGEYAKAEKVLQKAIKDLENSENHELQVRVRVLLSNLQLHQKNLAGAYETYKSEMKYLIKAGMGKSKTAGDCMWNIGYVEEVRGEINEAKVHFKEAMDILRVELGPELAQYYFSYGLFLERNGEDKQAKLEFKNALEVIEKNNNPSQANLKATIMKKL